MDLVLSLLPAVLTGIIAYLTYLISGSFKHLGAGSLEGICLIAVRTPAFDAFLTFVIQAVLAAMAVTAIASAISNHSVLSLDILYFTSLILLIMYHSLKVFNFFPVKVSEV